MQVEYSSNFLKALIRRLPRQGKVHLMQNLHLREHPPPIVFVRLDRPMNALQLRRWQFSHKETL